MNTVEYMYIKQLFPTLIYIILQSCPSSHPTETKETIHPSQVIACKNENGDSTDINNLIYRNGGGNWYNSQGEEVRVKRGVGEQTNTDYRDISKGKKSEIGRGDRDTRTNLNINRQREASDNSVSRPYNE